MHQTHSFFAYGTLKRGHCREICWPHPPESVQLATCIGQLHDLGPYPALIAGNDTIRGELWTFRTAHIDETVSAIDRVEGFAGREDDLYRRVIVQVATDDGETVSAYTYFFAQHLCEKTRIPSKDGECSWTAAKRN